MLRMLGLALLAGVIVALPAEALAMPQFLAAWIAPLLGATTLGAVLGPTAIAGIAAVLGTVAAIGISVGLSLLANSVFRPAQNAPRPEDMQQSSRQPTQPRARHYGRVKVSGPWVFAEASGGHFHKVLALGQGPVDAFEQFWIDDKQVVLDSEGNVQTDIGLAGGAPPRIHYRLGLSTETHYAALASTFSEWTSSHRGDGIASLYVLQSAVPQASYLGGYPNGINTNYRVVLRGAKVLNPVTGVTAWNDNAAAVIRDYMTHQDGMRLPSSVFTTPLAQAGWEEAYNRCNELIDLAGGGSERRYRLWGSYLLSERPADVLGRMLECCDGRLAPTSDGGLTLDIGEWDEPTVILDETAIVAFSDLSRGRDILTAANTVRATFLDPAGDYQAADADPWVDAEDVSVRGEIAIDRRYEMAPSHSQCRRLMKLAAYRANPEWVGTFKCNLMGLAAFGERFIRIRYPLFLIDEVFEVQDVRLELGSGGILTGVSITAQSMPAAAFEWDASQEEGDAPVSDDSQGSGVLTPDAPEVEIVAGPVGRITLPAVDDVFVYQARYKKTAESDWEPTIEADPGDATLDTPSLDTAEEYEFQLRLRSIALGLVSQWSASTIETT